MRKYIYLLTVTLLLSFGAKAAPGDTTWVQATVASLDGFGTYDSAVVFPAKGKSYRQILMIFTLGKHTCSSSVCGDWDYTVLNYLVKPDGQMYEMGRFITPYANASGPRTPYTWQQHYVYDVTDYAPLLRDSAIMRIFYSGYSGGFTGDVKFAFIEGAPDREVLAVHRYWNGSFGYGGPISINDNFKTKSDTAPVNTTAATMKFLVTGHGSDANGCCEFAAHSYNVTLNGGVIGNTLIWRDNCGMNEIYPQTGTWPINRANWCPGTYINPYYYDLRGVTSGTRFNSAIEFEEYTGGGSYTTEAQVFFYGGMKKIVDASIDDIIAPTNNENHFRENPSSGAPIIHVKNRGRDVVNSIMFEYGIGGAITDTFIWTGTLASLEERDITFPVYGKLAAISDSVSHTNTFTARIKMVNGDADADKTNNAMTSTFTTVPQWPTTFRIDMTTNNQALVTKPGICETSWAIYDMKDSVVKSRVNVPISTLVHDTISLATGSYKLVLYDSSCDGLNWWFHANVNDGVTSGSFYVRKTGANIPMNGYVYSGTFGHDFGCGYTQYFTVNKPTPAGVNELALNNNAELTVYPNPAHGMVNIEIAGIEHVNGTLQVIDALGRVVYNAQCDNARNEINLASLTTGVYTVLYMDKNAGRAVSRLVIDK